MFTCTVQDFPSCPTAWLGILMLVTSQRQYKERSGAEGALNQTEFAFLLKIFMKFSPCNTIS